MAAACMKNYQGACNYVKVTALKLLHLLLNSIHAYVTFCFSTFSGIFGFPSCSWTRSAFVCSTAMSAEEMCVVKLALPSGDGLKAGA